MSRATLYRRMLDLHTRGWANHREGFRPIRPRHYACSGLLRRALHAWLRRHGKVALAGLTVLFLCFSSLGAYELAR